MKIGIIGGTGLSDPQIIDEAEEVEVTTPFGTPASKLTLGKIKGVDVVMLARHGKNHTINPSNVNYRANIWALKEQGCSHVIAATACGSLQEEIKPGNLVFIDQFIDRTSKRSSTFYESERVCHIPMADPFCKSLRETLIKSAEGLNIPHHKQGTIITIEGPRFSSRSESKMFRSWGADVINMTSVPEVVLAREAGICYAAVAMSTDYDCFLVDRPEVNIDDILTVFKQNAENVKRLILNVVDKIENNPDCKCKTDINNAFLS